MYRRIFFFLDLKYYSSTMAELSDLKLH